MKKDLFSTTENLTARQKKILFRSWHRGTREADLLMGRFADVFVPAANEEKLTQFEELLQENDPDIYDWVSGRMEVPEGDFKPVLQTMIAFYRGDHD